MVALDDLHDDLLLRTFVHLDAPGLLAAECVAPRWQLLVKLGHEKLWRAQCLRAWGLRGPQPQLQLPAALAGAAAGAADGRRSAAWKDVWRDLTLRTSRVVRRNTSAAGPARLRGEIARLPSEMEPDRDGKLVVDGCTVRLGPDTAIPGNQCARAATAFPWIDGPGLLPAQPEAAGLGLPLLERVAAGSDEDHTLRRRNFHYYEVAMQEGQPPSRHADAVDPCTAVGLATRSFATNGKQPGWDRRSWGYHGDDGNYYQGSGYGRRWGPRFGSGDIVGCGYDCFLRSIFYTLNGQFMGVEPLGIRNRLDIFAVLGLDSPDEVTVNFLGPFRFDLGSYEDRRSAAAAGWWQEQAQEQARREVQQRRRGGGGSRAARARSRIVVEEQEDPQPPAAAGQPSAPELARFLRQQHHCLRELEAWGNASNPQLSQPGAHPQPQQQLQQQLQHIFEMAAQLEGEDGSSGSESLGESDSESDGEDESGSETEMDLQQFFEVWAGGSSEEEEEDEADEADDLGDGEWAPQ